MASPHQDQPVQLGMHDENMSSSDAHSTSEHSAHDDTAPGPKTGSLADLRDVIGKAPLQLSTFRAIGMAMGMPAQPGLVIDGLGSISMPVRDGPQAEAIVNIAEPLSVALSEDKSIDNTVPGSYEISAEKVRFTHPHWQAALKDLRQYIVEALGLGDQPIELVPKTLLFSKDGSHIPKHRDAVTEEGEFGTLILQLPSSHSGGHLRVFVDSARAPTEFDFLERQGLTAFALIFAVLYAGAEYEFTPVKNGYRLAMIYSVCWPQSHRSPPPIVALDQSLVNEVAAALLKVAEEPKYFHAFAVNRYPAEYIAPHGVKGLRGSDRSLLRLLKDANEMNANQGRATVDFYLADVKVFIPQLMPNPFEVFPTPQIIELYDLDGKSTMMDGSTKPNFELGEEDLLNVQHRSAEQLWAGGEQALMGIGPVTLVSELRKNVLIAWPTSQVNVLKFGLADPSKAFLDKLDNAATHAEPGNQEDLKRFCSRLAAWNRLNGLRKGHRLVHSEVQLRNKFAEKLLTDWDGIIGFETFFDVYWSSCFLVDDLVFTLDPEEAHPCEYLLDMMRSHSKWLEPVIQAKVKAAFEGSIVDAVVVSSLAKLAGLPGACYTVLKEVFTEALLDVDREVDRGEVRSNVIQATLWAFAFRQSDASEVEKLVRTYAKLDPEELPVCVDILIGFSERRTPEFPQASAKWKLVQPLLEHRLQWIKELKKSVMAAFKTWCFPDAVYDANEEVQAFLRGPTRKTTLRGFKSLAEAETLAYSVPSWHQQGCSFSMKAGGSGGDAFVQIMKTKEYTQRLAKKAAAWDGQLKRLEALLVKIKGMSSGEGSGSGSGMGAEPSGMDDGAIVGLGDEEDAPSAGATIAGTESTADETRMKEEDTNDEDDEIEHGSSPDVEMAVETGTPAAKKARTE